MVVVEQEQQDKGNGAMQQELAEAAGVPWVASYSCNFVP
jgi:hypothetical protein